VEYLEDVPAPPLGVTESPPYKQRTLQLEPGSTLLLYTDGLVEKSTEVLDVGLERLRDAAVGAAAGADVEALCDHVLGKLAGASAAQDDDVTMIALHALAELADHAVPEGAGDPILSAR
jgi:serine phosphatase RsbU (regulator of sigma subunit)